MEENPKVEEPKVDDPGVDDAQLLMEELKRLDITTPTDIKNVVTASQETGKAWNEVGNLRKEVDRLTRTLESQKPAESFESDYSGSVDLGKIVEDKVQGVLNRYVQGQQQAQQMAMQAMSEVKGDPEYGIVGKVFEQYINTPEAIMKLQTGQTNYKTEYLNTKAAYYRNLAQRSSKTLEGFMSKTSKAPPHVEQGDSQSAPSIGAEDVRAERLKQIKKSQKEGSVNSDQALDQIVKSIMPGIDEDASFFLP